MSSRPSSYRQKQSIFLTPLIGDLMFTERVVVQTRAHPPYGSAHPNAAAWPNHELVYVKERTEETDVQDAFDYYYAAERSNQDLYNWTHTEADIGGTKFDTVTRDYLIKRADFTPNSPLQGVAMMNIPAGMFTAPHVLSKRAAIRSQDKEFDSLYVLERREYVKRATLSDVKMNDETGRVKRSVTNLYYRGETVSGTAVETLAASPTNAYWGQQTDGVFRELDQLSENWFAIIESNVIPEGSINGSSNPAKTRVINRVTPLGTDIYFTEVGAMPATIPAYGSAHYDAATWPNHKLSLISPADASGLLFTFHYVADRLTQDAYNFSHTEADIGGTKFDAVARTYVTLRSAFTPNTPAMGAAMPNVPAGLFPGSHVLAEKRQTRIGEQELDSLYVAETHVYVKRCSIATIQTEDFFGIGGSKVDNLYYRGEVVSDSAVEVHFAAPNSAYWGWQADGTQRDGRQLSENWFMISIISSILDVIDAYVFSYPTLTNINLPRRLVDTQLTFNVNQGIGNQDQEGWTFSYGELPLSMSLGLTDSCSSSVSISPEVGLTFEDPDGGYTPATVYSFFLPQPVTMQNITDRVTTLHGSAVAIYTPAVTKTAVMALVSASASVRSSATASFSKSVKPDGGSDSQETSTSTDKSVSQSTQFVQVSGFLGDLNLTSSQTASVEATASMALSGIGLAEGRSASAYITDSASATASVTTSGEGGLEGSSDGAFIVDIKVEHYRFSRAKVFVVVVDL